MSAITLGRGKLDPSLVLGGIPRVRLLPREVRDGQKSRALRRRLLATLVIVVIVAVLATIGATFALVTSNTQLADEQSRSLLLAASRAKYSDVTKLQSQVAEITTSQPLAADGEILWAPYLESIQATLPAGTTITAFTAELADTKTAAAASTTGPIAPDHIADVKITADSPQQPISDWLDNLAKVPGFVAAMPGSVTLSAETGHYTVDVDLLVNKDALANRFTPKTGTTK
jgi:Tfp pilus assembly protein PilN